MAALEQVEQGNAAALHPEHADAMADLRPLFIEVGLDEGFTQFSDFEASGLGMTPIDVALVGQCYCTRQIERSSGKSAQVGDRFRENTGKLMKAGSKIRFDIHFHSVGEAGTAVAEVALWFYPKGVTPKYGVFAQSVGFVVLDLLIPGKLGSHCFEPKLHPAAWATAGIQLSVALVVCASLT